MYLIFNDLSIDEQFHEIASFARALDQLMRMRNIAKDRFKREIHGSRSLCNAKPLPNMVIEKAIGQLPESKRRAFMVWLTKGPFWDTSKQRKHNEADLLECVNKNNQVVTDTGVGEAAFRVLDDSKCGLVSMEPSDWQFTPVQVNYVHDNGQERLAEIDNFLNPQALENNLKNAAPPIDSWGALEQVSSARFDRLTFAKNCFKPLADHPFQQCSAKTLVRLLGILHRLAHARDAADQDGEGAAEAQKEAQKIIQDYFTGDKALFSDSSDQEKQHFKNKLTFPHPKPELSGDSLFCPYHGKEGRSRLRLHFSWPIEPREPVYVVYIGPKLTKK